MELIKELNTKGIFTIYTAKVAGGKTYNVKKLFLEQQIKIVFLSPLRALLNEVYEDLARQTKNVFILGGELQNKMPTFEILKKFKEKERGILCLTFELLSDEILYELKNENVLFVIDEFHLVYQWGNNFRPILHERFLTLLYEEFAIIGLTATFDQKLFEELEHDLSYFSGGYIHINDGNMELKYSPIKVKNYYYISKNIFLRKFWRDLKYKDQHKKFLIFVEFRGMVDEFVEYGMRQGYKMIGCVGGEVDQFQKQLKENWNNVDCIVSTSALSHGVNLPEIASVYIAYQVKDYSFWLQMIGRGGRLGSDYEVHHFDNFKYSKLQLLKDSISIYFDDFLP